MAQPSGTQFSELASSDSKSPNCNRLRPSRKASIWHGSCRCTGWISFFQGIGRAAVTLLTQNGSRVTANRQEESSTSARRGGTSLGVCQAPPPAAARPPLVKAVLATLEWRGRAARTAPSAPAETGLTLTGMRRLDLSPRHSMTFWPRHIRDIGIAVARRAAPQVGQKLAAAREPSAAPFPFTPKILSAIIQQGNRRVFLPETISGGGDVLWPAGVSRTSLRYPRTIPPQPGVQHPPAGTHQTLSGAAGVDNKTGAAIHATAAPGESE